MSSCHRHRVAVLASMFMGSAVAALTALPLSAMAAPAPPLAFVNQQIDALNRILAGDPSTHTAALRQAFKDVIDFNGFAQGALADKSASLSVKQRENVRDALQELLESRYLAAGHKPFDRNKIVLGATHQIGDTVELEGLLKQKEVDVKFVLKMRAAADRWRVHDVVIDGMSLLDDYRSQFATFLKKKSVEELVAKLHSRAQAYAEAPTQTAAKP
jgi:phospholipid transport system substrate-binding protein